MSTTYRMTETEAAEYDADGERADRVMAALRKRFGNGTEKTEVVHPDGYVVEVYCPA